MDDSTKKNAIVPAEMWSEIASRLISPADIAHVDRELADIDNLRTTCKALRSAFSYEKVGTVFAETCKKNPLKMLMLDLLTVTPEGKNANYGLCLDKKADRNRFEIDLNRLTIVYKTLMPFAFWNSNPKVARALRESIALLLDSSERITKSIFPKLANYNNTIINIETPTLNIRDNQPETPIRDYRLVTHINDNPPAYTQLNLENTHLLNIDFLASTRSGELLYLGTFDNGKLVLYRKTYGICFGKIGHFSLFAHIKTKKTDNSFILPLGIVPLPDDKILIGYISHSRRITDNQHWKYAPKCSINLARFLPNGTFDTTFGDGGQVIKRLKLDHDLNNSRILAVSPQGTIILGDPMSKQIAWRLAPEEYQQHMKSKTQSNDTGKDTCQSAFEWTSDMRLEFYNSLDASSRNKNRDSDFSDSDFSDSDFSDSDDDRYEGSKLGHGYLPD